MSLTLSVVGSSDQESQAAGEVPIINRSVVSGWKVTFEGKTQACAGNISDRLHTLLVSVTIREGHYQSRSGRVLNFALAPRDANGPRFVLTSGKLGSTQVSEVINGRVRLHLRSGSHAGTYRLVARDSSAPGNPIIGKTVLRVNGAELLRRFPWRWVGHTDPNEITTTDAQWHDEGYLSTDVGSSDPVAVYKFYLKCRRDARRGDLDGNWDVVNGHRLLLRISEVCFSEDENPMGTDIVLTDPRRIAHFWQIEGASRRDPTSRVVITRRDGAAQIKVRRVKGFRLPRALAGRDVSYTLSYTDLSQDVDDPPTIPLDLRGRMPQRGATGRARLFAPPQGVSGVLAWTIAAATDEPYDADESDEAGENSVTAAPIKGTPTPHSVAPSTGLYMASVGKQHAATPRRYPFWVQGRGERENSVGLTLSPDARHVAFGTNPELLNGGADNYTTGASLWELDLATGRSRALIKDKDDRADFNWSPDGRYLKFSGTSWDYNGSTEGFNPYDRSYPVFIMDMETGKVTTWKDKMGDSGPVWTHDNHLLWSKQNATGQNPVRKARFHGCGHIVEATLTGKSPGLWRDDAWDPQTSADGRQIAFMGLQEPERLPKLKTADTVARTTFDAPFSSVLWVQPDKEVPRPLTHVERTPDLFWTRDGAHIVSVTVNYEDVHEYWSNEVQRGAQVTVWNASQGTIQNSFELQGQRVKKASGFPVREKIAPLGISPDGHYLFLRYEESDPKTATREKEGTVSQGIFAIDLMTKHAYLIAGFRDIVEVVWQPR